MDQPAAPVDQPLPVQEETTPTTTSTTEPAITTPAETPTSEETTTTTTTTTPTTTVAASAEDATLATTVTSAPAIPVQEVLAPENASAATDVVSESETGTEGGSVENTSPETEKPSQEISGTETNDEPNTTPITTAAPGSTTQVSEVVSEVVPEVVSEVVSEVVPEAVSEVVSEVVSEPSEPVPPAEQAPEPVKEPVVIDQDEGSWVQIQESNPVAAEAATGAGSPPAGPEQPVGEPVTPGSGSLQDLIGQPDLEKPLSNMTRFEGEFRTIEAEPNNIPGLIVSMFY